jgi:lipopolysaccharide transport system ATP-binding protein
MSEEGPKPDLAIRVRNVSKSYELGSFNSRSFFRELCRGLSGRRSEAEVFYALKGISFDVRRGEVFGILGNNGSGKSTLLKILSRITKPTTGRIEIDRQVCAMLELGSGFHPELTGRENIYLYGSILGMRRADIEREIDEIVEFSGIGEFLDTPVKRYSSGMFVRLAFSVMTQLVSDIMLVDEVLSVGDADFQRRSLAKIDELCKRGKTVLLVSHSLFHLDQICDRVLWLENGRVRKLGTFSDISSEYLFQADLPQGYVKFPRQAGDRAHLISAYVQQDRTASARLLPGKPVSVFVEYEVEETIPGLLVGFRIWNPLNVPVLSSEMRDSDLGPRGFTLGHPGRKVVSADIPAHLLGPGQYLLELGLWSPDVENHHHAPRALTFHILSASDMESPLSEPIQETLPWTLH